MVDRTRQWAAALEDVLRGIGGGLVFDETLDFMSAGEETTETLVFTRDPRGGRFSVAVTAFKEP